MVRRFEEKPVQCQLCNTRSVYISETLGVCAECIKEKPAEVRPYVMEAHRTSREAFGLPESPPKDPQGVLCNLCVNECRIPEHGIGYCGLRRNENGKLVGVSPDQGKLSWYHDRLPTNCVGDWVCPGGMGTGYPTYAYCPGPEIGYKNLAVFFQACSFNCLFCQNWHFKHHTNKPHTTSVSNLLSDVDEKTSCICYFGGDPTPQLPFALKASRLAVEREQRILRICWETNGTMNERLLDKMIQLSLDSGGCIKFDLKAWNEDLHCALTGVSNKRTLQNFRRVGEKITLRPTPPLLIASTLLVPGYVDQDEVRNIARFIAAIDPYIPYSLLGFYPHFYMSDLPLTPKILADRCYEVALEEGLTNVKIGNVHLLV